MLFCVGIIIIRINDILVPHVSKCVGHLRVIVNLNEVMVVYSNYMTAVGDVVCVPYWVACSEIVFLCLSSLCSCIVVSFELYVIILSTFVFLIVVWFSVQYWF